jgi:hypothetical protein
VILTIRELLFGSLPVLTPLRVETLRVRELPTPHSIAICLRVCSGTRRLRREVARLAVIAVTVAHAGRSVEVVERLGLAAHLATLHE